MDEIFAKPAVSAIIEKQIEGEIFILIQQRQKENGGIENGMLEIPGGKIREYENIFDGLRREVWEETGLNVTEILGEEDATVIEVNGYKVKSFIPFLSTQNLKGGYSIMLQTFICHAEGTLLKETNESTNIKWVSVDVCKKMIGDNENSFYPMHINVLKKYLALY